MIFGVSGKWSLSSCWSVGAAPSILVAGLPVPGIVQVRPLEHCPAHLCFPSLIPVPE